MLISLDKFEGMGVAEERHNTAVVSRGKLPSSCLGELTGDKWDDVCFAIVKTKSEAKRAINGDGNLNNRSGFSNKGRGIGNHREGGVITIVNFKEGKRRAAFAHNGGRLSFRAQNCVEFIYNPVKGKGIDDIGLGHPSHGTSGGMHKA